MSKPKYLRSEASPASIIVTVEAFVQYIFTITNNEKQFPKAFRYTLTSQLRNECLMLHRNVYAALAVRPRYRKQYKKHLKRQQKVYDNILDIKALLVVATSVAKIQNMEHLTLLLTSVVNSYNRWVKNDRRLYKNLPTKKQFAQDNAERRERSKQRKAEWRALPRDAEGFIILYPKGAMPKQTESPLSASTG